MKTPPAEAVWKTRAGNLPWPIIWRIRAEYVSPRDKITWMQVRHRTLWVATPGGMNKLSARRKYRTSSGLPPHSQRILGEHRNTHAHSQNGNGVQTLLVVRTETRPEQMGNGGCRRGSND